MATLWELKEKYNLTDVYDLHEILVMKTINNERYQRALKEHGRTDH